MTMTNQPISVLQFAPGLCARLSSPPFSLVILPFAVMTLNFFSSNLFVTSKEKDSAQHHRQQRRASQTTRQPRPCPALALLHQRLTATNPTCPPAAPHVRTPLPPAQSLSRFSGFGIALVFDNRWRSTQHQQHNNIP